MNRSSKFAEFLVALAVAGLLAAFRYLLSRKRLPADRSRADEWQGPSKTAGTKRWLLRTVGLLAVLGAGAFLVVVSGIVPIKASSGHWPITEWVLQFAKSRSVATHTLGIEAPALEDPSLVLKGATHYEIGCRPCHGNPDLQTPRIAQQMTPRPPYLPTRVSNWTPDELFYIVKHGIKFTGMPAWPAQQRDDEVWAMVAFLLRFPELSAEEYRRIAKGESAKIASGLTMLDPLTLRDAPRAVTENCARCHGVEGPGMAAFPRLTGQRPAYLFAALRAFANGERRSGIMEPIAAALSVEDMRELALYYADLPHTSPVSPRQQSSLAIERGEAIANGGIRTQRVPACVACHGPGATPRNPIYPDLAGQYAEYLVLQLMLFKKQHRGGSPYARLMLPVAARLKPEQIRDVALYYASLAPTADTK
jgi:cytochrome c553/cytochrome c5